MSFARSVDEPLVGIFVAAAYARAALELSFAQV
jgi:hypothetical protein